ncbi:hypothetical protein [uncultured Mameliella sp.]|uniref:hypothetical protein n=1 Tax=uncultured Mameliella sp. TaxID=1447087 RepID=UPI0026334D81|nr:hypothetical protein [uncultured Mameliella sp.]
MASFFSTLSLGLIAALVGSYLQYRNWRYRALDELRRREYEEAVSVIREVSEAIDGRLYAQRRYTAGVDRKNLDKEDADEYKKAVAKWMSQFSSLKSRLRTNFGRSAASKFEHDVHGSLQDAGAVADRTRNLGYENLSLRDKAEHDSLFSMLNFARLVSYDFLNELSERAAAYDIGTIQYVDNIRKGDVDAISRTYLLLRLLGLKA